MQTQVMFYLLNDEKVNDENKSADVDVKDTRSALYHACLQASYFYRQNQRVFIYTQDQQHAEQVDEMLWAFDSDSFVPHNLAGEGQKQGAGVEISHQHPKGRRPVLINLTDTVPAFANQFNYMVDFVPSNEIQKQQARIRFKTCKQWGFKVDNQAVAEPQ
ncbi:MAG: DNA polymerase III subunit chi [Colwellia sp.]